MIAALPPVLPSFARVAARNADAVAVTFGETSVTYGELASRSRRLAAYLISRGVGPEVPVGVRMPLSIELVVALLGVLEAGGVYLPLDPTHPEAMLAAILADTRPALVLHEGSEAALPKPATKGGEDEAGEADPSRAATLFFTSGTTGKPKGVVGTLANLAHHVGVAREAYRFCEDDVFLAVARPTFSISIFELLSPLCVGARLRLLSRDEVLSPSDLAAAIEGVTVLHFGPSLLASLFRHLRVQGLQGHARRTFPGVRHASSGGDHVPPDVRAEMHVVFPNAEVFVIYGCTEVSCMATTARSEHGEGRASVGAPFPGVTIRLLDEAGLDVARGELGEVHIAGAGCARGYFGDEPMTAERFVDRGGLRFYASGDLGRLGERSELELVGRRDFQVKIRGIRVELLGIEATVRRLGLATGCAVVARESDSGDASLVAFLVEPKVLGIASLRRALAAELPEAMLPRHLRVLDALPLNANGKLDRRRLQTLGLDVQVADVAASKDASPSEQVVMKVFAASLEASSVGLDDDFFEAGGDSLLATVVAVHLGKALGREVPPLRVFESRTPRALAARLEADEESPALPIPLSRSNVGPSIFALSGVDAYRRLGERLEGRCALQGVVSAAEIERSTRMDATHTVEDLAREQLEIVRRTSPRGPYRLLGFSFAGIVAYEAAQQLRRMGEDVELLTIVDVQLPEWKLGSREKLAQLVRVARAPARQLAGFALRQARSAIESLWMRGGEPPVRSHLRELDARRDIVNQEAARAYIARMKPYDGRTLLLMSRERVAQNPANTADGGFAGRVARLEIETLAGGHHDLLRGEAQAAQFAELLVARLARVARGTRVV